MQMKLKEVIHRLDNLKMLQGLRYGKICSQFMSGFCLLIENCYKKVNMKRYCISFIGLVFTAIWFNNNQKLSLSFRAKILQT